MLIFPPKQREKHKKMISKHNPIIFLPLKITQKEPTELNQTKSIHTKRPMILFTLTHTQRTNKVEPKQPIPPTHKEHDQSKNYDIQQKRKKTHNLFNKFAQRNKPDTELPEIKIKTPFKPRSAFFGRLKVLNNRTERREDGL